jgi:hypothetical protein
MQMKNYIPVHNFHGKEKNKAHDSHAISYDKEAFMGQTDIGIRHMQQVEEYERYGKNPMGEDTLAFWKREGLKKELFDKNQQNGDDRYSVFTPLDMQPDKKYALLYISHGGGQTIEQAEHYGFNKLAAREKFIAVYAMNGGRSNQEVDTEFLRILKNLQGKNYPIDWERIYPVGFSSGSEATVCAACTAPQYAAAIGVLPGGQPFKDLRFYTEPEYYASTRGMRIPGCFIGGTADIANFPAPWISDPEMSDQEGEPSLEERIQNLSIWMDKIAQVKEKKTLNKAEILSYLKDGRTEIEREFGLTFHREYSFEAEGCHWIGGDNLGTDEAPVMRCIRAVGVPHIVWDSQINLVWDYLKHFRRDSKTGQSIYDPVVCWGER